MLGRTNTGGGGGGLNFQVIGGTTAPNNPKENMIWVNTATKKIDNWIFSAMEPESLVADMVWIIIGTSSDIAFNALKKNSIQVYPISAKQYSSGSWVDVTAKSYQGGAWVDWWTGDIYANGQFMHISGFTPKSATVSNSGGILTIKTQGNVYSCAYSNEAVDLTGVSEIDVYFEEGSKSYSDINQGVCISDSHLAVNTKGNLAFSMYPSETFSGKVTVNVETVNREAYIGFTLGGRTGYSGLLKISKIEMRR